MLRVKGLGFRVWGLKSLKGGHIGGYIGDHYGVD